MANKIQKKHIIFTLIVLGYLGLFAITYKIFTLQKADLTGITFLLRFALFFAVLTLPFFIFAVLKWNPWTDIWQDTTDVNWMDIVILGVILVICYFSFNQNDLVITMDHGKDFLISVFNGDFFHFYEYAQADAVNDWNANYYLPTYILFGIWNLPVMLIFKIAGLPFETTSKLFTSSQAVLWWNKLLPVLFFFGCAYLIYKISLEFGFSLQKAKWAAFLWISFPIAIYSQFIFGQYDSFGVFFTLLAFLFFLKKDLTKFSILLSIAFTFKILSFFAFIPLLLYAEKRFWHVIKYVGIAMLGIAVFNLMFIGDPYFAETAEYSAKWARFLFETSMEGLGGRIGLFPLTIVGLSIYAYTQPIDKEKDVFYRKSVFLALAGFALFFAFSKWHPQWVIYLTPFLVLSAMLTDKFRVSMYLDIALSISFLISTGIIFPIFNETILKRGFFPMIFGWEKFEGLKMVYTSLDQIPPQLYFNIFVAIVISYLVFKFPRNKQEDTPDETAQYLNQSVGLKENNIERDVIWVRMLSVMVFIVPVLVTYLIKNT